MRGKKFSDSFQEDSEALFTWAYTCFLEERYISEHDKGILIDSAVKMHNRAKTITNPRHSESVTNLKSAAAWILTAYADKNTKFCILFIRLHCRIASEWIQIQRVENAINSYKEAVRSWRKLNITALDRLLPQGKVIINLSFINKLNLKYVSFSDIDSGAGHVAKNCVLWSIRSFKASPSQ